MVSCRSSFKPLATAAKLTIKRHPSERAEDGASQVDVGGGFANITAPCCLGEIDDGGAEIDTC